MTRGLNPPDTLSAENVHTLRSVRRDIYYQGIIGGGKRRTLFVGGSVLGHCCGTKKGTTGGSPFSRSLTHSLGCFFSCLDGSDASTY
mmetsp:Transcript_11045/g.23415  ORF Transcript_11045/g.23415 Transcript_11045/m.23415 type:complete len:87 (+) Transcript_11045:301-561(+)